MSGLFRGEVDGILSDITFFGDHFQWETLGTGTRSRVPADSIVAVIPVGSENILLYLKHEGDEGGKDKKNISLETLNLSGLPPSGFFSKYTGSLPPYLAAPGPEGASSNVHIVLSTLSGTQGASVFFSNALKPLLSYLKLKAYEVHETRSAETIIELAKDVFLPRALSGHPQTIILLSGDGGLIDLIKVFSEVPEDAAFTKPVVCLIPMGTGNGTANSTGLLSDSTFGLSSLLRGSPKDLPAFRVRLPPGSMYVADEGRERIPVADAGQEADIYGVVVASWGMHASLVADSDTAEYRKFGVDRFKMAAKELLHPSDGSESHRYRGTITLVKKSSTTGLEEEHLVDRESHMYVLVTLVSQLEKGFMISPSSEPLDGQLRIVHFGPVAPGRAMELMGLAYQGGKHTEEPEVGYAAVEAVRIRLTEDGDDASERWRRLCIDGKIVSVPVDGESCIEVRRSQRFFCQLVM
ncbi:uncharacterized protein GIQ15_06350 [Arthroderma uncinatum]|uniref:uncharacterized protein n=1 Tax=Arthroderma uncinatum TaxID=74035 RepID=UPI00144A950F|nr:uncharacterized protein GIQ15_06350 [Arthroderma uncinatum]KAF3481003.1 hypothetical protein GIQ15_06350 [Arthroderma uncinatum]